MNQCLTTLYVEDNLDAYLQYVDFDGELDSVQFSAVRSMYRQYADFVRQTRGGVTGIDVLDADFESDTVCYVHYQLTFADSSSVTSMQKVILDGEIWKIRSRN